MSIFYRYNIEFKDKIYERLFSLFLLINSVLFEYDYF
jgi:hypothetical protein